MKQCYGCFLVCSLFFLCSYLSMLASFRLSPKFALKPAKRMLLSGVVRNLSPELNNKFEATNPASYSASTSNTIPIRLKTMCKWLYSCTYTVTTHWPFLHLILSSCSIHGRYVVVLLHCARPARYAKLSIGTKIWTVLANDPSCWMGQTTAADREKPDRAACG